MQVAEMEAALDARNGVIVMVVEAIWVVKELAMAVEDAIL